MKSYKDYPYNWITLTEYGFSLSTHMHFNSIMDFWGYCYVKDRPQDCNTNAKLVRLFDYLQSYEEKATLILETTIKEPNKASWKWETKTEEIDFKDIEVESWLYIYYNGKKYEKGIYSNEDWYYEDDDITSNIKIRAGNQYRFE